MILLSPDANQANFKHMAATVCSIPLFFCFLCSSGAWNTIFQHVLNLVEVLQERECTKKICGFLEPRWDAGMPLCTTHDFRVFFSLGFCRLYYPGMALMKDTDGSD